MYPQPFDVVYPETIEQVKDIIKEASRAQEKHKDAQHGLKISSDDRWIEKKMTKQYLGSLVAKNLVKARSYDVWRSDAGYPARVKYWAPESYVKLESGNKNHVKTTFVQLANEYWEFSVVTHRSTKSNSSTKNRPSVV